MASKSSYLFVRTCERLNSLGLTAEERGFFATGMKLIMELISQYYSGKPAKLALNSDDMLNMY